MTNKLLLIAIGALAVVAGTMIFVKSESDTTNTTPKANKPVAPRTEPAQIASSHTNSQPVKRVPAYQSASEARNLPATLEPAKFFGKAKAAYIVAKQIPETLAQLPCYCHCDQGFGHKSLHTCFVDDHAAHCAVCVDEALLAYRLQLEEKLTPEQVRERIVEKYSVDQHQH
jgi:hypothetical protein